MENTVLITGAGGGLAASLAGMLKARGMTLVAVSRNPGQVAWAGDLAAGVVEADVSTTDGAAAAAAGAADILGGPPRHLAHCAGAVLISPAHRTRENQYRECMAANLDSAFFMLSAFLGPLVSAKLPGAAVFVSSVAARIGIANHEAVAAAKGAVEGMVRSAAATYAVRGIRVNAVAPGLMRTPATERFFSSDAAEKQLGAQYPLGRYGSPDDIAGAMAWLLSDAAGWVTGQVLAVDGGFTAVRPMVR
jgi:NAD(P)-dependent dehydrogenase (short-subunit alcohol dehydrogenase family)